MMKQPTSTPISKLSSDHHSDFLLLFLILNQSPSHSAQVYLHFHQSAFSKYNPHTEKDSYLLHHSELADNHPKPEIQFPWKG